MKKASLLIAAPLKAALLILLLTLASCATYNMKTAEVQQEIMNGQFRKASELADKNKFLGNKRNRLLYYFEKGKIEHMDGNYKESNAFFEKAYILIDDGIKSNAGYALAATFTNPMAAPYKGEDFEKVAIHYYMALNYFMMGQPDEALVEAKRINIKLLQLNDKYTDNKNKYTQDAFSQILQGIIYESTGDINNAFIAYRNAEEIYTANGGSYFGVTMPEQLKQDLLRTSYNLGFTQEYNDYVKKFGITNPSVPAKYNDAEAIIFWENGLAPIKDQIVITASGGGHFFYGSYMEDGIVHDILLPIPFGTNLGSINAIAIPKYGRSYSYYGKASVLVNGKESYFQTAEDYYPIAKQCLQDRMLREAVNMAVRFAAKKGGSSLLGEIAKQTLGEDGGDLVKLAADAAGAITEKADTRNWQSLPATIGYTRVPLTQTGENKFIIKKYGPNNVVDTDTITIPYRRGLQVVNYFDLGRTQILPQPKTDAVTGAPIPDGSTIKPDAKFAAKYDKWVDTPKGISYKLSYYPQTIDGRTVWGKKVLFKTGGTANVKVTYTITDKPYTDKMKVVSLEEFEKLDRERKAADVYYYLTDTVKAGAETPGWYPFVQESADVYLTIFKTE
nr:hypothetical protein [uncultured Flavobacterium sp.]